MEALTVTPIQFNITWENKEENFSKIEALFFKNMAPGDSDFLVLPEMFATGFTMNPFHFWEEMDGMTVTWLKKWAMQLNACIGGGIITKTKNNQFQNTFAVAYPDGKVETYHKRHLFRMGEENKHYVQGNSPRIIDIKGWKINLQICYDLRFPVFVRNEMVNNKPKYDALVYIANWPEARTYAWTSLLQARAIENQAFVIGVNRVGQDGNKIAHSGESAIISPIGQYIVDPIVGKEGKTSTALDYAVLSNARSAFPLLLDADQFKLTDN